VKRAAWIGLLLIAGLAMTWAVTRVIVEPEPRLEVATNTALTEFGPYRAGMNLRQAFESLPPVGGEHTGLSLLAENTQAWAARWRMLAAARERIDVSYFILREDVFGAAFLGHLLEKARRGVHIRLLLDSQGTVMSFTSPRGNDWLDTMANSRRVEVKLFRPLLNRYLEALATVNPVAAMASEHDKILVCDRAVGMIGGRNISTEYFAHPADFKEAFEDSDVVLEGARAARGLGMAFETQYQSQGAHPIEPERLDLASYKEELLLAYRAMDAWLKNRPLDRRSVRRIARLGLSWSADLEKLPRLRGAWQRAAPPEVEAETRLLDSNTRVDAHADVISQGLLRLVQGAREHILVQSPYLVLSEEAVQVLTAAGRRGVKITLYTNSPISSDNALSQAFFLEQWPELLARVPGLRIFVTGGRRTLHSKLMVFDDEVALVGTYNLDPMSMAINSEIMVATWSHRFARRVGDTPRKRLAHGPPLVFEYTVRRDARGQALRDERGRPLVAFGPKDHTAPATWRQVQVYWALLRAADRLPGFSPLF
jgi:cardiolipin synthase C